MAMVMMDPQARVLAINERASLLLGQDRGWQFSGSFFDLVSPLHRESAAEGIRRLFAEGQLSQDTCLLKTADGREVSATISGACSSAPGAR